ncbi:DUF3870 domain-containing protein [Microbacterium sp. zg.B48]|uniref:DUF3870 domain-containing protein n=1 Tax=Microbacterium sp. zg.B48 TaxID=2969408 RepID=UPI00214C8639|nr:DUF3870 domain-containing protein [Microbacterium sp. zg.B48]MCR2765008.1 DUF3870 domain-containing protein [Microbacterium sp. zg.B48]
MGTTQTSSAGSTPALIVVGYGKVPMSSAAYGNHGEIFAVSLVVDRATHVIQEADCTAVTTVVRHWFNQLFIGRRIDLDPSEILDDLKFSYLSPARGSMQQAIIDAWSRYARHLEHDSA